MGRLQVPDRVGRQRRLWADTTACPPIPAIATPLRCRRFHVRSWHFCAYRGAWTKSDLGPGTDIGMGQFLVHEFKALDHEDAGLGRCKVCRHPSNGVERRHQRVDLGRPRSLFRDDDHINLTLDVRVRYGPCHEPLTAVPQALVSVLALYDPDGSSALCPCACVGHSSRHQGSDRLWWSNPLGNLLHYAARRNEDHEAQNSAKMALAVADACQRLSPSV
jgi:hypothetical protein